MNYSILHYRVKGGNKLNESFEYFQLYISTAHKSQWFLITRFFNSHQYNVLMFLLFMTASGSLSYLMNCMLHKSVAFPIIHSYFRGLSVQMHILKIS